MLCLSIITTFNVTLYRVLPLVVILLSFHVCISKQLSPRDSIACPAKEQLCSPTVPHPSTPLELLELRFFGPT